MNRLTILLYHGITKQKKFTGIQNYNGKHLYLGEFEKQMKWIKDNCNIVSMDDVIKHHKKNVPYLKGSVAITFDDGYKNVYDNAIPILKELNILTTFYITIGKVRDNQFFVTDTIEQVIDCNVHYKNRNKKISAVEYYKKIFKNTGNQKKIKYTQDNEAWIIDKIYYLMSLDDIESIKRHSNIFLIGGHGFYHYSHDIKLKDIAYGDIWLCAKYLREDLFLNMIHYSYPEGRYNDFVIELLKTNFNILCCPTADDGFNTHKTDLFKLKRIAVGFKGIKFPYKEILK